MPKYVLGKVDYNRSGRRNCKAEIEWTLHDGRFSMSANIWNPRGTDIYCGGQCVDTVTAFFPRNRKAHRMLAVWRDWHLNDMQAGTSAQTAWLKAHSAESEAHRLDHYDWATKALAEAGLNPDNGYRYGSAWLKIELPPSIVAEIESWSAGYRNWEEFNN